MASQGPRSPGALARRGSPLRRWLAFNLVGLGGFAVQIGTVALLVHVLNAHYLLATAVAVEAAVLHNFAWHQQWTWSDRPAGSRRDVAARLWRFHLLNGAISLGANLALVLLVTGVLHVPVVFANVLAVVACSLANFVASDAAVFRTATTAGTALLVLGAGLAQAQEPDTAAAWNAYQSALDTRFAAARPTGPFFVRDQVGSPGWRDRARRGEVQLVELDPPSIPGGRIHHWAGAVWVPGATVASVIDQLQREAGTEATSFEDVVASKLLSRDADTVRVFMKMRRSAVVSVTYNTEHEVEYRKLGATRATSRSVATRIAELAHAGTAGEREKPAGEDNGFLWRLVAYWRYEETAGGVLVECESVTLSRPVPMLLRPVAGPIVGRIARESLERTLTTLRRVLEPATPSNRDP